MENVFDSLGAMAPVYLLFLMSGLIIYAVSSWVGEALLTQIRESKTSVFGRAEDFNKGKGRALYVPPAQISTVNQKMTVKNKQEVMSLPVIPDRPNFKN